MTFAPGIQSVRPRFLPAPLPGRVYSRPTLPNLPWGDGPMSPINYQRDVTMVAGPAYYARAERGDGVLAGLGILSTDDLTAGVKNAIKRNLPIVGVALGALALGGLALWTVLRKPKPARKNRRRNPSGARPFYVSTFCNFAHRRRNGGFKPYAKFTIGDTELHTWFERDRAHVELRNKQTDSTMLEFWDDAVQEAVDDGFLSPRDWHASMFALWQQGWRTRPKRKRKRARR